VTASPGGARPDAGAKPAPRPEPPKPKPPEPEPKDKPAPEPPSEANLEVLVTEAETAARNGQYGKGLKLCEDALRQDKSNVRAMTTCAVSACNLKLAAKAKNYINRLQGQTSRQAAVRQICLRLQVPID
jgi:outer membrane biosynthesis protein TonB